MKKVLLLSAILLFVLVSCSCPFNSSSNVKTTDKTETKSYVPDVQWKLETNFCNGSRTSYTTQCGQYLYSVDYTDKTDTARFCIRKIDLNEGSTIWLSDSFTSHISEKPVICGDYIFIEEGDSTAKEFYCFKDSDGKLAATISVGESEEDKIINSVVNDTLYAVNGKYIIWSNGYTRREKYADKTFGILKIAVSDIDFEKAPEEAQIPPISVLYKTDRCISTHFTSKENVVYFQTYTLSEDDPSCLFGAVNAENGEILWKNTETGMKGRGEESLVIVNDEANKIKNRLYSLEYDIGCYNLDDGTTIWEKIQTEEDLLKEPYLGGLLYNVGVTYCDGFFYYTTIESNYSYLNKPDYLKSNIKCINAKTGKFVWGYLPKDSGSLMTRPVVANGKVFVLTDSIGLCVFNAKTGDLIGNDASVLTDCYERNALWNGNVIYFDFSSGWGTIYSIKP